MVVNAVRVLGRYCESADKSVMSLEAVRVMVDIVRVLREEREVPCK